MKLGCVVIKLCEALNMIKDFVAGYSTRSLDDGYLLITYRGKRYAVKISEIENPSEDVVKDIDKLPYLV